MAAPGPREPESLRRLVLVVGIGRSGTSVFTRILDQLGFHVPKPELEADDSNPRGFAEPRWVVDFHARLMRERGVTVFDSRPAAWQATAGTAEDGEVLGELRSWLAVQFVGADDVVVKDPRIGWFLPLWLRCGDDLGVATSFATMLRHPAEVVRSAREWYGEWQSDASRAAAWVNVTLHTEEATRGARRAFVRYEDLLADWAREVARVAELLDLSWLVAVERSRHPDVDTLVDPHLRRSAAGWEEVRVPAALRELADGVWERVSRLAEPAGDDSATHASLDEARGAYARLYAEAEAIAQSSVTAAKARRARARRPAPAAADAAGPRAPLPLRIARRIPARYRRAVPLPLRRAAVQAGRWVGRAIGR